MFLSIIICSRNRAHEIVNCLPGLAEQARQFPDAEVIIVDNGSTDNTAGAVKNCSSALGYGFRYVFEPVAGLCQARNRGRQEAKGTVLAYIDDDAIVTPGWIQTIRDHFMGEKSDCLGGKVSIRMEGEMPFRLEPEMEWFFMASTLGEKARFLSHPQHPTGCNMAFLAKVFDAIGGFNTHLKLYGDETDFFRRVYEKGFTVYYNPAMEVSQVIPAERMTKRALKEKSLQWGQGAATNYLLTNPSPPQLAKKKAEFRLRTAYMAVMSTFRKNFGGFYTYWYNRGFLSQLRKGLDN
jgi:glycosyltransferase involved in cell wall biosynthesis